jgi:DNA-binding IclR family transcriptional regulator
VSQSVRAVERALDILLCFTGEGKTRSLAQIVESVHMSKTTVYRLLTALEKKRFISKEVPGRYCLDSRFIGMAPFPKTASGSKALRSDVTIANNLG